MKVSVITAVLIDGEQAIDGPRKLHQRNSLFKSCGKRLIDDHITARLQTLPRERIVRLVRSGNHDEANLRYRQQFVQAPHDSNVGILLRCFGPAALQNRVEMQTRHGANHRRVKRAASETESYEADFNHSETSFGKNER